MAGDETSLPQATHPTAKAFFDALDGDLASSKQSENLRRKSQSLGWRNRHSQSEFYPVAVGAASFSVKQVQRGEIEGTYGTGATVWPAAVVLIKYLERQSWLVKGKLVVDLGAGTGVTSIAAALLGASHVVCTDGEESVVRLASQNVNHVARESPVGAIAVHGEPARIEQCSIPVQTYWWGDGTFRTSGCDVVLVADCVLPKLYPIAPLIQAIDELLEKPDSMALLSYENRYFPQYDPREKFRELAAERGLQVVVVDQTQLDPVYSVDDIEIWHVTRKRVVA